ncbi:hypothetical protein VSS22_24745 [Klebsiella pneumoniae]|jgi:hypothetical protein|uniref:hypothetical protein n=1 Tax=Klebsiella TaxID=570 RepID=UPI0018C5C7C6|nr:MULTISPECIES: hypothetical protein [Klebsiella]HCC2748809.1 hypothetical protein [Klebsiella quasipneumoniae]MBD7346101.1 hypothetical protein [Klebsiella pneumoniae]MBD7356910.1 hypothetical protein [Klebsiella pneumoniae]MBD7367541.1 hypothetical protein [Klebsiella pneumoniae]MBD7372956.1 hypothetical protein [Klebsiella pneumoniae]
MSTENSAKITFTFNGNAPQHWITTLNSQRKGTWIDPQSSGSKVLLDILTSSGIDADSVRGDDVLVFSVPSQREILSELLGIYAVSDARVLLIAATPFCPNLSRVVVTTHQLLSDGSSVSSEQKALRNLFFMTQNGICIRSDLSLNLDPAKLPGSRFFACEDDMEQAGIQRWGENGGDAWRAMATIMHGKKILINGAGQMLELGNTPEERINAVNN